MKSWLSPAICILRCNYRTQVCASVVFLRNVSCVCEIKSFSSSNCSTHWFIDKGFCIHLVAADNDTGALSLCTIWIWEFLYLCTKTQIRIFLSVPQFRTDWWTFWLFSEWLVGGLRRGWGSGEEAEGVPFPQGDQQRSHRQWVVMLGQGG